MGQSAIYRERRNALAAWLCDRYATDESVPDAAFWRDAADCIKFLTANGLELRPIDD